MNLPKDIIEFIPDYQYNINFSKEDDAYIARVEELSWCITHGSTKEEALKMAYEAVEAFLETLFENKLPISIPYKIVKLKNK